MADHLAAGQTVDELKPVDPTEQLRSRSTAEAEPFTPYTFVSFADAAPILSNNYLVKGLIEARTFVVLYGASGVGKSFLASELGLAIASGKCWRNQRTLKGTVIYVAAEGARGMLNRMEGAKQHMPQLGDASDVDFHLCPSVVTLGEEEPDVDRFVRSVLDVSEGGADLVVIDTLSRSMKGNENSTEDMMGAVSAATRIMDELGCAVLLIHHSGKNEAMGMRGSSALRAAVDTELELKRADDDVATLTASKQKEGEAGATWQHQLQQVEIGIDEDGEAKTTAIVAPLSGEDRNERAKARATGGHKKQGREVVTACLDLARIGVSVRIPADALADSGYTAWVAEQGWEPSVVVKGFSRKTLRDLLIERYEPQDKPGHDRETSGEAEEKADQTRWRAAKKSANRWIKTAIDAEVLQAHGDYVWLKEKSRDTIGTQILANQPADGTGTGRDTTPIRGVSLSQCPEAG